MCCLICLHDCCNLWNTDTGYDTRCTDRTRSDTDLYGIHACIDHSLCTGLCSYVTSDNIKIRILLLDHGKCLKNVLRMSMCCIDNDCIYLGLYKLVYSVADIRCNTNGCGTEKSALCILGCIWILDLLLDILDCNKSLQHHVIIDDRKLLFSGFSENCLCLLECDTLFCCNEILRCHGLLDLL